MSRPCTVVSMVESRRESHDLVGLLALPALFLSAIFLSALLGFCGANAQAPGLGKPAAPSLDLPAFQAELRRIQDVLQSSPSESDQIAALERGLPSGWEVDTPERKYEISCKPLHFLLNDALQDQSQRNQRIAQAREWIAELAAEVNGYSAARTIPPDARAKLARILDSPEFGRVYKQSAWERFKQRINAWIWRKVGALLQRMSGHPLAARALAWLILLLAVVGVALLLFRAWIRRARLEELKAPAAPAIQSWQEWVHIAQLAADRGAYREAVHALYWASIVYLENARAILPEPSRTPRERLRQLRARAGGNADDAKRRDVLQALTFRLERVWYGGTPATQQDFIESTRLIEELGCRW